MKKENTAIRLKKIMSDRSLRQVDILNLTEPYCKEYGVKMNKSDISQYCSGKTEPNQDKLFILGVALDVSEAWLMGYDVPMRRNDFKDAAKPRQSFSSAEKFKAAYDKSKYRSDRLMSSIIENAEKLNNDGKKSLLDYSGILLGNPKFVKEEVEKEAEKEEALKAAHERTDVEVTKEMKDHDDRIMEDDSEWE